MYNLLISAQVESGCLLQHNSRVYSGTNIKTIPKSSVEKCAEACTEKFDCNMFSFNDYKACYLYRKGEIHSNSPSTSGFCPKGNSRFAIPFERLLYLLQGKQPRQYLELMSNLPTLH